MPVVSPQIAQGKKNRQDFLDYVVSLLPDTQMPNPPTFGMDVPFAPSTYQDAGRGVLDMMVPQPEDTLIAPAELALNYRTPAQIQGLRKVMAEEQRARGPINNLLSDPIEGYPYVVKTPKGQIEFNDIDKAVEWAKSIRENPGTYPEFKNLYVAKNQRIDPDPYDQLLRGSWYHGMSEKARGAINGSLSANDIINLPYLPGKEKYADIDLAHVFGFPLSRHDSASISNKLGEPAGVSLSLNPTISGKFSADENIFRVMPLYGGPPQERVVNLMTAQGRNALNDAYDVVANSYLSNNPELSLLRNDQTNVIANAYKKLPNFQNVPLENIQNGINYYPKEIQKLLGDTGTFNQALSDQLQSQGYRGILYNPQRWGEHEMLMLDPKYALPLDYRPVENYTRDLWTYGIRHKSNFLPEHAGTPTSKITPQAAEGLNALQDVMAQNHSRLGDIYAERSWWDRLSPVVKEILLQDNPQAEMIIQKLKGGE